MQVYESSSKEEWSLPAYSYRANSKYYLPWGKNYTVACCLQPINFWLLLRSLTLKNILFAIVRPVSSTKLFMSQNLQLIHWIKSLKVWCLNLIRNTYFNLEQLKCSSHQARPGISTLKGFWDGFDSDAKLFICQS